MSAPRTAQDFLCVNRSTDYQVTLYNGLGVTGSLPITLYAVWLVVALFGNLASATILMDKYGRKRLLMIGIVGTGGCLVGLTIITKYFVETNSTNKVGLGFGIFFIFLYVVFYSTFIDSEQYVIVSETFPIEFRTIGVALSLFSQTAAAALFVGVAPVSKYSATCPKSAYIDQPCFTT